MYSIPHTYMVQRPSRKQQNLKGTYRGAKTHEGNRVVSLIHSWAPPYREELKELREATTPIESCCIPHTYMGPSIQGRTQVLCSRLTTDTECRACPMTTLCQEVPKHREQKELRRLPRLSNTLRKPLARRTPKG